MPFEDSIAKLAVDISDTFAKEVHSIIGQIILEENDFVSRELEMSKVTACAVCFAVISSHTSEGHMGCYSFYYNVDSSGPG